MARADADGDPSVARNLRNLGYVPPEFQGVGRVEEDPDELGYTFVMESKQRVVKNMVPSMTLRICNDIMPEHERAELTQAAMLCHRGHHHNAERHRAGAGYDGL
jgi:hypothetical protein